MLPLLSFNLSLLFITLRVHMHIIHAILEVCIVYSWLHGKTTVFCHHKHIRVSMSCALPQECSQKIPTYLVFFIGLTVLTVMVVDKAWFSFIWNHNNYRKNPLLDILHYTAHTHTRTYTHTHVHTHTHTHVHTHTTHTAHTYTHTHTHTHMYTHMYTHITHT